MKKALFAVAVLTVLAGAAQAGDFKWHDWPTTYVPQTILTIPVSIDVGYWIRVKDQGTRKILLKQVGLEGGDKVNYKGCVNVTIQTNTALQLSVKHNNTSGKVPGTYGATVSPNLIAGPENTVEVCATISGADIKGVAGGKVHEISQVVLMVVPAAQP